MAITISTGTTLSIATALVAAKVFETITNAAEAVASYSAIPSLVVGDYVVISSGWGRLDRRVARVKAISGSGPYLVTFEGVNTTDTARFPAGSGGGSTQRITGFTPLSQVKEMSVSGGDQQYADITSVEDVTERQVPTIRSAISLSATVMDDPALAWYATVQTASDSNAASGLLMSFPNGSKLVANGYWSLQKTPNVAKNEALTVKLDVTYAAEPMRYAT